MGMEVYAAAKLNLTLDVLGKRPDGYHDLRMLMQSVGLYDRLTLELREESGILLHANRSFLPSDSRNLAVAAAERFLERVGRQGQGVYIELEKHIPVRAGLGGGSSDAAAVLRGLNELLGAGLSGQELEKLGEQVGSDVPYCIRGGTALAEGRGELLTPLRPLPHCYVAVCKPAFPISTPTLFSRIDSLRLRCRPDTAGALEALAQGDLGGLARRMYNVFEEALPPSRRGDVERIKSVLIDQGALGACMSGTGPTVFGLFREEGDARGAVEALREEYQEVFLGETV